MTRRFVVALAAVMLASSLGFAQEKKAPAKKAAAKRAPNPAYAPVEDVPGLPRVLILGDSISIGYTVPTRDLLKGVANVHRPTANCGPTITGLREIDKWLATGGEGKKWDVIHFNWGLHDLKYIDDNGKNTSPDKGRQQVPLDQYEKNLETLVQRLKQTGARLIFATTTPVPPGEPQRKADSDKQYNEVAVRVMNKHGVTINDLNAFVRANPGGLREANVHYTDEGYKALAQQAAAAIRKALGK